MKKVTRRYRKKDGTLVEKTYEYGSYYRPKDSTKGYNLITKSKSGKVSVRRKNVEKLKKEIDLDDRFTDAEKKWMKNDLETQVELRAKSGKTLTSTGYMGTLTSTKADKFFANMGRSTDDIAAEMGVDEDVLRDEKNWDGDSFTDPATGIAYFFDFKYVGTLWR